MIGYNVIILLHPKLRQNRRAETPGKQNKTARQKTDCLFWLNPHEVIQPRETSGWVQNGQVWVQAGASILNRVQFERDKSIKQTRKGFLKTFEQLYLFQKNKLLL